MNSVSIITNFDMFLVISFEPAKNSKAPDFSEALILLGRDGEIRTHDPLHPMQVRYRAALHPDLVI